MAGSRGWRVVVLLVASTVGVAGWQEPAAQTDPQLQAGRQLLARLDPNPRANAAVLRDFGYPAAGSVLAAVMANGQRPDATSDDWVDLHRAIAALVVLHEAQGDLLRASVYASLQDLYYRNNEQDYEAALAAARLALDLTQRGGQGNSAYPLWSGVGTNLRNLGRTEEALVAFRTAQSQLPDPHASIAANLSRDVIQGEIALGNLAAARVESARFSAQSAGAPPLFRARALLAQSDLLIAEGQYDAAFRTVMRARDAGREPGAGDSILWEAANQFMVMILDAVRTLPYGDALALASRVDAEVTDLPFNVAPFARTAVRARRRLAGEIDAVLRDENDALTAARAAANVPGQIEALRALAATYRSTNGRAQQAQLLEEALELERALVGPSGRSARVVGARSFYSLLTTLGDAYLDLNEPGRAATIFDEALRGIDAVTDADLQRQLGSYYADAVLGKARVAELDDDPDQAREMLTSAIEGGRKGPGRFDRGWTLLQLARLERAFADRQSDAVARYEQAIEAFRADRNPRAELSFRLELARFLTTVDAKRMPDALDRADRHLASAALGASLLRFADAEWRVHYVGGLIREARGDQAGAIVAYQKAVARLDTIRAGLGQQEQRQSFVDNEAVEDLYRRLLRSLSAAGRRDGAWASLEGGKARSFLEMLQGRRFSTDDARAPEASRLRAIERQIIDLRVLLAPENESALRGAGKQSSTIEAELRRLEQRFTLERQQAAIGQSRAGQALALTPPSLAAVQRRLAPDTALLEFGLLPGGLTAFVVTNRRVDQITWETDTTALKAAVVQLRGALSHPSQSAELGDLITRVSTELLAPVAKALPRTITHLLIVPTAYLNYLPFQVLTLPSGAALIDAYTIGYLPSAATLQFLPRVAPRRSGSLFVGALGNVAVEGWIPLPGTLAEADAIARVYPEAQRASERAFTHDRIVAALGKYDQVHLATHGLLDEQAPLFSALLAGPAQGQASRLSLYEVPDLKLRARLVVMSACETGLGKLLGGDEVSGLTRTFLLAGADTIVSSLWKVSDEATALLMAGFYERLKAGASPSHALRDSSLALRKTFPHPFYWAPFVVTGAR